MSETRIHTEGATVIVQPFGVVHASDASGRPGKPDEDWISVTLLRPCACASCDNDSFNEARFSVRLNKENALQLGEAIVNAAKI